MVRDTPPSQDVFKHQICNSYLKEYRRYGLDTKAGRTDGLTDSAFTICLPKFLWGHKKVERHSSYDLASGSEIRSCNKIDKPLVVYRFSGNGMTSITTLHT